MQVQPNKDDVFPQHVETGPKGLYRLRNKA